MSSIIIAILYLTRPILFIEFQGVSFALLNIIYLIPLLYLGFTSFSNGRRYSVSLIEKALIAYTGWGTIVGLVYIGNSSLADFVKLVTPTLSYFIFRRSIRTVKQYVGLLKWLLAGFSVPVFWSALLISRRQGKISVDYFSGVERFTGVYGQIHGMGHNMGLILILATVLYVIVKFRGRVDNIKVGKLFSCYLVVLGLAAGYCLVHAHVRTVYLGLFLFFAFSAWKMGKVAILSFCLIVGGVGLTQVERLSLIFQDVIDAIEGRADVETAGSGRGMIWMAKIAEFQDRTFDKQLIGVGLSGEIKEETLFQSNSNKVTEYDSHNEYLQMLLEYGIVGILFVAFLYGAIWRQIALLRGRERLVFEAFFLSVIVMNFMSNSYISRFGLAQMFYMILLYVDLPAVRGRLKRKMQDSALPNLNTKLIEKS